MKLVRFQVLTAATMKTTVFWVVSPRRLFTDVSEVLDASIINRPNDGGSKYL
jgi:hypothetical protein